MISVFRPAQMRSVMLAAAVIVTATGAKADGCARDYELPALQARVLQTDLMVAALTCDARPLYNAFITKYRPELIGQGRALKAYFNRTHGKRGVMVLDAFVTRLANEASLRTVAARGTYCANARMAFTTALAGSETARLTDLAARHPRANSHGIVACALADQQVSAQR